MILPWLGRSLHHLVKTVTMLSDSGIGLKVLTGQGAAIGPWLGFRRREREDAKAGGPSP